MKRYSPQIIIHFFALLHAAATVLCRLAALNDELLLTLLTMCMMLLLCVRKGLNVEFSAALMIIVNAFGYILGNEGAVLVGKILSSELLVHALVTLVSTEIVGWGTLWAAVLFGKIQPDVPQERRWSPRVLWLLVLVLAIFVVRIVMVAFASVPSFRPGSFYYVLDILFRSLPTIIILLLTNVILVRFVRSLSRAGYVVGAYVLLTLILVFISVLAAGYVGWWGPRDFEGELDNTMMLQLVMMTFLVDVVMFSVVYLVDFTVTSGTVIKEERAKRHQAQFEYLRLKQQVNPHFLFNSLNILDCMVVEGKDGDASEYIHKLANMYRYLLQNEGRDKISLREEMGFVDMYVDLLRVRFPRGFIVEKELREEDMDALVVPCSVQLLVENCTKHNVVSEESPLHIEIRMHGRHITVRNNLQPRIPSGVNPATNVGLNYIRRQYLDLTGRSPEVAKDNGYFSVTLPLIYD